MAQGGRKQAISASELALGTSPFLTNVMGMESLFGESFLQTELALKGSKAAELHLTQRLLSSALHHRLGHPSDQGFLNASTQKALWYTLADDVRQKQTLCMEGLGARAS